MKNFYSSIAIGACLLAMISGCSQKTEDQRFMAIADEYFDGYYKANPISATWIGVHDYDGQLDDVGSLAMNKERVRLDRIRSKLLELDTTSLSMPVWVDYRILRENIDEALFSYNELREFEWNPRTYTEAIGNSIMLLITQDFAPQEKRLSNALERTKEVARFLEQAKANLRDAPKIQIETAILQNKGNISIFKEDLPKAAEGASEGLRKEISNECERAIAALDSFGKWMETELMGRSRKDFRLGEEMYNKKLSHTLKSSIDPNEILKRAEAEKAKTHVEMYALALPLYKEYYKKEPKGLDTLVVIKAVLDKIVLEHPKRDEVMTYINGIIPQLTSFIKSHDLITLDDSKPMVVRETPEFERGVSVASLESPGPLEKNLKTFFNVTPIPVEWTDQQVESYLREYNNYSLHNLSIHEGIPGHYVQLYYSNRNPSLIRSVLGSGSMVEGWAVYTERMMVENGYMNNDPRMKLINLKWYIRVVINAIIDHKIHAGTMTEQEAKDLMMKDGFQEEREAAGKWRRANLTAAQLSTYFVGYQEIMDLRKAYQEKMGDQFSLKEFHEKFVSYGSPSVKYIRETMLTKSQGD